MSHGTGLYDALGDHVKAKPYWAIGKGHNDLDYNFEPMVNCLYMQIAVLLLQKCMIRRLQMLYVSFMEDLSLPILLTV